MNILVFLGSVRDSTPPRPARLGARVAKAMVTTLKDSADNLDVTLIDPLDYDLSGVFKPHFAYSKSQVPEELGKLAEQIKAADAYVMVSPEYNHSMSPALSHLLNHFGSSLFSYKPSAIVTYSAGQWGGMRAAVGMRTFLAELGCLPVSAMIHIPRAQQVLTPEGIFTDDENAAEWTGYFGRTFSQLIWWAEATKLQRDRVDPDEMIGHFKKDPSQRNAPGSEQ